VSCFCLGNPRLKYSLHPWLLVKKYCSNFTFSRLLRDQNTSFSRRIGFVIMSTRPMAQLAIQNLDNTIPNGATEPIYVKYADEEGKKRHGPAQNHNGHNRGFPGHQQNHHHNNFQNNNFMNQQQHGFNFNNNNQFMMGNNQSQLNQLNNLNLGKMKNSRSNGLNRYNPIGGATGKILLDY